MTASPDPRIVRFFEDQGGVDMAGVGPAEPLFSSGLVDSFTLIELLAYLDSEFGVETSMADLRLEDIDTLGGIDQYIRSAA